VVSARSERSYVEPRNLSAVGGVHLSSAAFHKKKSRQQKSYEPNLSRHLEWQNSTVVWL
jgi:hypothetical protein